MYTVKQCLFYDVTRINNYLPGYVITSDKNYPFWVNRYIHSLGSSTTAKQYAYKICIYLNYLESVLGKKYYEAETSDLDKFFVFLATKEKGRNLYNFAGAAKSGNTMKSYFFAIKGLYEYIINKDGPTAIKNYTTEEFSPGKHSLLYSQNIRYKKAKLTVDNAYKKGRPQVDYIKWYSEEQVEALFSNFNSIRDKAIFAFTLDGLRIDEVLSLNLSSINSSTGIVTATRSKGRMTGDTNRSCKISDRAIGYYREYLFNERTEVETDIINQGKIPSDKAFINLRKGNSYGEPLKYNNFLEILKNTAARAGLDPKRIRTHSGRSTAAMSAFKAQLSDPSLTDEQIKEQFGWKNIDSARPYKNHNDDDMLISIYNKLHKKEE